MENPFAIQDGIISANCRTVAVLLAGVALVMGAKRLFIAGMDGYMATSNDGVYHFYNEKNEAEQLDALKEKHNWNLNYLKQIDAYMIEQGGEGLHILTPTNYKEFYKGLKNYL
jgi:4-hydroxy 2-oxovalerate aldolase